MEVQVSRARVRRCGRGPCTWERPGPHVCVCVCTTRVFCGSKFEMFLKTQGKSMGLHVCVCGGGFLGIIYTA